MNNYLSKLNPIIKDYFNILSSEFPEFLLDYINTPRMQKQKGISTTCGMYYSKMFNSSIWYSSLDHSVAVSLIVWHFTHDKKQTLAGLFHDIATPSFKHSIDFMNNDYENQESTEDLTKTMIEESTEIMSLLKKDNISIDEVCDYHIYPICDNDTPMLSADRLEYTLSNGLGVINKIWDLDEIEKIYSNIKILNNENNIIELGFTDIKIAERFVEVMSELSIDYMCDKRRFGMQLLADLMKRLNNENLITIDDLYEKSEEDIINIIKNSKYKDIFNKWANANDINTSKTEVKGKYCVKLNAKRRYINPLVLTNNKVFRISTLSLKSKNNIDKCIHYSFDDYLYMNFNF